MMIRLTGRDSDNNVTSYNPNIDSVAGDKEIRERLAAYEDTGLMPEEVAALAKRHEGVDYVRLTCWPGETVYYIDKVDCNRCEVKKECRLVPGRDGRSIPGIPLNETFSSEAAARAAMEDLAKEQAL